MKLKNEIKLGCTPINCFKKKRSWGFKNQRKFIVKYWGRIGSNKNTKVPPQDMIFTGTKISDSLSNSQVIIRK